MIEIHDSYPNEKKNKREFARKLIEIAGNKIVSYPVNEDSKSLADTIWQVANEQCKKAIRSVIGDRIYYQFTEKQE